MAIPVPVVHVVALLREVLSQDDDTVTVALALVDGEHRGRLARCMNALPDELVLAGEQTLAITENYGIMSDTLVPGVRYVSSSDAAASGEGTS